MIKTAYVIIFKHVSVHPIGLLNMYICDNMHFVPDNVGYFLSLIVTEIVDPFFCFRLYLQYEPNHYNILMRYAHYTPTLKLYNIHF